MEENEHVFCSKITRANRNLQNNLYDLINIEPAKPVIKKVEQDDLTCYFLPRSGKQYSPKKCSKFKVKTVRNIREIYENDINTSLPNELEKQRNSLLKKITSGSSTNEKTKSLAKGILKSGNPISRSAWQMLMNINPEGHTHSFQYTLWNGTRIRLNGSKGGSTRYLYNYDLSERKTYNTRQIKKNPCSKSKRLLHNSLKIKFKPGPLSKKEYLDDSYQRKNIGTTELTKLPTPGIEILPIHGVSLDPTIATILHSLRDNDGKVTENWANFATSMVGSIKNTSLQQNNKSAITFDLTYKSNRNRILMRRDIDDIPTMDKMSTDCVTPKKENKTCHQENKLQSDEIIVKNVIENMISSVEISLDQDNMYTGEDEPRDICEADGKQIITNSLNKEKLRRKHLELDRLDVTIIRLPETNAESRVSCQLSHCILGCICTSLQCQYKLKEHCGRPDCIFECKCDFSKYNVTSTFENPNILPGLVNFDNQINAKLAKEEQKFHQTVVLSGERSILLKSARRNWKASKRYAEFYSNMPLKSDLKINKTLSIVDVKLDCTNLEPWCMVHNLYKCFCHGKFTNDVTKLLINNNDEETETTINISDDDGILTREENRNKMKSTQKRYRESISENTESHYQVDYVTKSKSILKRNRESECKNQDTYYQEFECSCARVLGFKRRKFHAIRYSQINAKIANLEKNDINLQKRMTQLINQCEVNENMTENPQVETRQVETRQMETRQVETRHVEIPQVETLQIKNRQVHNREVQTRQVENRAVENETCVSDMDICIVDDSNDESQFSASMLQVNKTHELPKKPKIVKELKGSKFKLVTWLESTYKQYKERMQKGVAKTSLEPPTPGKMALYPWNFILSRYKERKNLFMLSKQRPFRIFMAVEKRHSFFNECINIDDIGFADLHKYPITVKNLLTNATDLSDNFCILCGLSNCWELIGSVSKIKESSLEDVNALHDNFHVPDDVSTPNLTAANLNKKSSDIAIEELAEKSNNKQSDTDHSKWFVMTVENDFSEIQFYQRGFFVKYESIIKAINVARLSGKTVRLSSVKASEQNACPPFGIYAIPNVHSFCVFIGPYKKEESLGIETVRTMLDVRKTKKTKGVWISTKNIDNSKVIDDPLSYMPTSREDDTEIVGFENETAISIDMDLESATNDSQMILSGSEGNINSKPLPATTSTSVSNTNRSADIGFTQFSRQTSVNPQSQNSLLKHNSAPSSPQGNNKVDNKKPIAEIAPQVKTDVVARKEKGMLILKPEEINKRIMEKHMVLDECRKSDSEIDNDIENFLANSEVCDLPYTDAYIISDEEMDINTNCDSTSEVYIECKNSPMLGWIRGRKNLENHISFEFPGFKFSEFYPQDLAFGKINQVLKRKIFVAKDFTPVWEVVEAKEKCKGEMLNPNKFRPNMALTQDGYRILIRKLKPSSSLPSSLPSIRVYRDIQHDTDSS